MVDWGKLSKVCLIKVLSVSHHLCMAQQILVHQIFDLFFLSFHKLLPSFPLKSQTPTLFSFLQWFYKLQLFLGLIFLWNLHKYIRNLITLVNLPCVNLILRPASKTQIGRGNFFPFSSSTHNEILIRRLTKCSKSIQNCYTLYPPLEIQILL